MVLHINGHSMWKSTATAKRNIFLFWLYIKQLKAGKSCKTCVTNHTVYITPHYITVVYGTRNPLIPCDLARDSHACITCMELMKRNLAATVLGGVADLWIVPYKHMYSRGHTTFTRLCKTSAPIFLTGRPLLPDQALQDKPPIIITGFSSDNAIWARKTIRTRQVNNIYLHHTHQWPQIFLLQNNS